jgi:hypothetical protein
MLHDQPGNRIRLFYASEQHTLFRNPAHTMTSDMTLSVHPHHCDLTLVRLFGRPINVTGEMSADARGRFHECLYSSAILGGKGALEPTGRMFEFKDRRERVIPLTGVAMAAPELHTVFVERGLPAAWLVLEGKPDPNYKPLCFTANPHFDMAGMYVHGSQVDALTILQETLAGMDEEAAAQ